MASAAVILLAGQSNMVALAEFITGVETCCVAVGGSRIQEWLPGTDHFEAMRPALANAEALFFWQGESDAIGGGEGAERWDWFFGIFAAACRMEALPHDLPIIFAQTPNLTDDKAQYLELVQIRQRSNIPDGATLISCPEGLPMEDHHHLAEEGLRIMAKRFLRAYEVVRSKPVELAYSISGMHALAKASLEELVR